MAKSNRKQSSRKAPVSRKYYREKVGKLSLTEKDIEEALDFLSEFKTVLSRKK